MSDVMTLEPCENTERASSTRVLARPSASASDRGRVRVPIFVGRDQLYYWTREWQAGEADALADLAARRFRTFRTGRDAAAWLLRDED